MMNCAIATTITMNVCVSLSPADKFANANVNLAVNSFQSFAPLEPSKAKKEFDVIMCEEIEPIPDGFTIWDKVQNAPLLASPSPITIAHHHRHHHTLIQVKIDEGELTLADFLSAFTRIHFGVKIELLFKHGITDDMIAEGKGKALYNANPYIAAQSKVCAFFCRLWYCSIV